MDKDLENLFRNLGKKNKIFLSLCSNKSREDIFDVLNDNYVEYVANFVNTMYQDIEGIDLFFRGKKSKGRCFRGNKKPFYYLVPYLFASCKESSYGKLKQNKNIIDADVEGIINDAINEETPETIKNTGISLIDCPDNFKAFDIFCEIRDSIAHPRMISNNCEDMVIYIDNPFVRRIHEYTFRAIVHYQTLYKFIESAYSIDRRYLENSCKRINEPNNESKKIITQFSDIKDNIEFYSYMLKNSSTSPIDARKNINYNINKLSDMKNKINSDQNCDTRKINLTQNQENMIDDFFLSEKHKFDLNLLSYIAPLIEDSNGVQASYNNMIGAFFDSSRDFTYREFVNKYFDGLNLDYLIMDSATSFGWSKEKIKLMQNIFEKIKLKKQGNGQPLLYHKYGISRYIILEFKKRGFKYNKEANNFKKGEIVYSLDEIDGIVFQIYYFGLYQRYLIDEFPNRLKLQFVKFVYSTIDNPHFKDNGDRNEVCDENNVGERPATRVFTEDDHIRDALIHNRYTHLHGIDYILLRDGYNKKNNLRTWEGKYNINGLYKNSYKKILECIADSTRQS